MSNTATAVSPPEILQEAASERNNGSFLVDTAISHCEKLRRIVELETWINGTPDSAIFAATRRKWQEERARLLAELQLHPNA